MTEGLGGGGAPPARTTPPPHDAVAATMTGADIEVLIITAPRCHHCRAMQPALDRPSKACSSSTRIERIDATVEPDRVDALGVMATPTVIMRVGGREHARLVGRVSDRDLEMFFAHAGDHRPAPVDGIMRAIAGIVLLGIGWWAATTVLSVVGAGLTMWAGVTMWRWSR